LDGNFYNKGKAYFLLRSFALTQKNQKVKTQQSSHRTRLDAGSLLRLPTAPTTQAIVVIEINLVIVLKKLRRSDMFVAMGFNP
jgi:hypothetical protein